MTHKFVNNQRILSLKEAYHKEWLEKAQEEIQDQIAIYFLLDFKATYYEGTNRIDYEPFYYADYATVGDFLETMPRPGLLTSTVLLRIVTYCFHGYAQGFHPYAQAHLSEKELADYQAIVTNAFIDMHHFFDDHKPIVEQQIRNVYPLPLREFVESVPNYEKYWHHHMERTDGEMHADSV